MVLAWLAALVFLAQSSTDMYDRAHALLDKRDLAGARAAVDEALRINPRLLPALTLKAKLAMASEQLEQAQQALEAALAIAPKQSYPRFLLGVVFYLKNDFPRARQALALADRNDSRVALYEAMTQEGLGDSGAAVTAYERALKLDRSTAEPRVAYARFLFKQGDIERAETLVEAALKLEPNNAEALYEKGQCRFELGQYGQAAEFGERALAQGATSLERRIRYLLVRAYQKQGALDLAEKHRAVFEKLPMPLVR
jgi:tetratricopeptide (TPR) repeat protein